MTDEYLAEPHRQPVVEWLLSKGFIEEGYTLGLSWSLGISWSTRAGIDNTELEFYPLNRHANDMGWDAIVGHHASGTNPRTFIGRCENLADVQMVYETIRRINGYREPEPDRENRPENGTPPPSGKP